MRLVERWRSISVKIVSARSQKAKIDENDMMDAPLADGAIGSTVAFGAINLGSSPSPPASFPVTSQPQFFLIRLQIGSYAHRHTRAANENSV